MTPGVAIGIIYLLLFNGSYGRRQQGCSRYLRHPGPFWTTDPHWVKPGLVIMMLIWGVGASVVIFLAALVGVPQHLYEAAEMDGAAGWRRFRDVTLPMISPAIFFVFIIHTIAGLQTFDQVYTAFFNQSAAYGTNASLFYAIYLFQQAFTFFNIRLRVGARVGAVRDHRDHHRDPDRRQSPFRLLRRERQAMSTASPVQARARPPRCRRRSSRSLRAAAGGARRRGNPVARVIYLAVCSPSARSSSSTRSVGSSAASLKPRDDIFDNNSRLIPSPWHPSNYLDVFRGRPGSATRRRRHVDVEQLVDRGPGCADGHVLERPRRVRVRVLPLPAAATSSSAVCSRR